MRILKHSKALRNQTDDLASMQNVCLAIISEGTVYCFLQLKKDLVKGMDYLELGN